MCSISEFWCQALWGHCQVIPGEEASSLVDTPPRKKISLFTGNAGHGSGSGRCILREGTHRIRRGEQGHCNRVEVPRLRCTWNVRSTLLFLQYVKPTVKTVDMQTPMQKLNVIVEEVLVWVTRAAKYPFSCLSFPDAKTQD